MQQPGSLRADAVAGFGRSSTDGTGHSSFTTLVPGPGAPFFAVTVFARGSCRCSARAYLPVRDSLLEGLNPDRRSTLSTADATRGSSSTCASRARANLLDHGNP